MSRAEWAEWARAAGRCRSIADALDADSDLLAELGNRAAVRLLRGEASDYRTRAELFGRRARVLHARVTS